MILAYFLPIYMLVLKKNYYQCYYFFIVFHILPSLILFLLKSKYYFYLNVCTHPWTGQQSRIWRCLHKVLLLFLIFVQRSNSVVECRTRLSLYPLMLPLQSFANFVLSTAPRFTQLYTVYHYFGWINWWCVHSFYMPSYLYIVLYFILREQRLEYMINK